MPRIPTDVLLAQARTARAAVAAFNVITLEYAEGVVAGAEAAGNPVILQVSHSAVQFHGRRLKPLAAACRAIARDSAVGVALHFDRVDDPDLLPQVAELRFDSVAFDASRMPRTARLAATRRAAAWAHAHGLWCEAELGRIGVGLHADAPYTDPVTAKALAASGIDALVIAERGARSPGRRTACLNQRLIAQVHALTGLPLVLRPSCGIAYTDLTRAINNGVSKINVSTAIDVAFIGEIRHALATNPTAVNPQRFFQQATDAVTMAVAEAMSALRTNHGGACVPTDRGWPRAIEGTSQLPSQRHTGT